MMVAEQADHAFIVPDLSTPFDLQSVVSRRLGMFSAPARGPPSRVSDSARPRAPPSLI